MTRRRCRPRRRPGAPASTLARAALTDALEREGPGEVNLYLTAPQPHRAGPPFASAAEASAALEQLASRRRAVRPGRAERALERACFRHATAPGDLCRRAAACGACAAAYRGVRSRRSAAQLRDRIVRAPPRVVGTGRAARPFDGRQLQSRGADAATRDHRRRQTRRTRPGASGAGPDRRDRISQPRAGRGLSRGAYAGRRLRARQRRLGHRRRGQIDFDFVRDADSRRRRRPRRPAGHLGPRRVAHQLLAQGPRLRGPRDLRVRGAQGDAAGQHAAGDAAAGRSGLRLQHSAGLKRRDHRMAAAPARSPTR